MSTVTRQKCSQTLMCFVGTVLCTALVAASSAYSGKCLHYYYVAILCRTIIVLFLFDHRRNVGTLLSVSSGVQQLTANIMLPELMVSETFRSIEHVSLCWSAKWSNQAQDCSQVVKPVKPARVDYSHIIITNSINTKIH